jgi:hypothetical protein
MRNREESEGMRNRVTFFIPNSSFLIPNLKKRS